MRFILHFFLLIIFCFQGKAQLIPNSYYWEFNLHPDSISKFYKYHSIIDSLTKIENPDDSIKKILSNLDIEEFERESPFDVGPIGCSWYCAASPDSIFSQHENDAAFMAPNVHDMDLRSSWQGKVDSNELTITFKLSNTLRVTSFGMYNGKCASLSEWENYARVKTLLITVNDTTESKILLEDSYFEQELSLGQPFPKDQNFIKFTFRVLDVYPGKLHPSTFHISEINFDGVGDH